MKYLELLAPAKNYEQGCEAVNHGADALYIGAPAFGARAAATLLLSLSGAFWVGSRGGTICGFLSIYGESRLYEKQIMKNSL